jgi:scyllo-inositol 2-dehydrogenase (NADP+)
VWLNAIVMAVRQVVVGLGNQGQKRQAVAGSDIVATVDPFNAEAQYESIDQVPLDTYDGAFVCTPDGGKLDILEFLLANGKHVMVEKPLLIPKRDSALKLQQLAERTGAVCYTAYNHRFEPHITRLKGLLQSGDLGEVYLVRLFYGNGTAKDVRLSPWRDRGLGVLADLGSHLLDMVVFLFGDLREDVAAWKLNCFENKAFDHVVFGTREKPVIEMEATLLSWRNHFSLDLFAEKGSAHIDGLCKWGPSTFITRQRKLPSGKPEEERSVLECADPTWELEYEYFKELSSSNNSTFAKDLWISEVLYNMAGAIEDSVE